MSDLSPLCASKRMSANGRVAARISGDFYFDEVIE
jgi:hypothetical protein